ncbi:MAG: dienelactone hydrolase family protein, partial [Pirellulaceae bacterium]
PWPEPCPLESERLEIQEGDGYRIEKVTYRSEPEDRIPAYLLIPDGVEAGRAAPAICVWHQHNGQWHLGKSEPAGLDGNPMHHTGAALAREGYVVLCPDALGFEEREKPYRLKGRDLERYLFLRYVVSGRCMAWKNILDMRRAVDYLVSRPEVLQDRIGCYGHSMGSTHTWMVGPWEPRLRALVGNCCLPTYAGIHEEQLLHCFPNFVPGIYEYGDTPDIAALMAPRALHLNFGDLDRGSPINEVRRGIQVIERSYESKHAEAKFTWFIEANTGHVLSVAMWKLVRAFFTRHLKSATPAPSGR